jgi:hypothetical protein
MSDMEGKVTRVGASERGQRTSFKKPRYRGKAKVDFYETSSLAHACSAKRWPQLPATPNLLWIGLTRQKLVTHS